MTSTNVPIFLSSDDNYAPFVATTIASILDNTEAFVDFYVLDSGISEENKRKIGDLKKDFSNFSIEYISIDLQKNFGHFPLHIKEHTLNVFSRYLIPQIKPELKKVIYMDVDIIVHGDLKKLYDVSLENFHLGAIPEYTDVLEGHKKDLGISNAHKYFNAGILVIDCEYFRENNLTDILIKKTLKIRPKFQDQDILNMVFENNYKILDYKYNVSWYMSEFNKKNPNEKVQEALDNPFIVHYSTFKPWNRMDVAFADDFWKYARRTIFFEKLFITYLDSRDKMTENKIESKKIKLFGLIPVITINNIVNDSKIYLFNLIPILKIRRSKEFLDICFLSWKIVIVRIKIKNF